MTAGAVLRIGTRGSRLALAQARILQQALDRIGHTSRLVTVATRGDAISARRARGGVEATDGQFTAELEDALLRGDIDMAIHSYKDLPTAFAPGLGVAAVLPRADARDCLLSRTGDALAALGEHARIGTSSVRRALQLLVSRPDLRIEPIRGNVDTRILRMERGDYDGVLLACAGLDRLGVPIPDAARLPYDVMLPAPAQGALAIQVRTDRADLVDLLTGLDDRPTRISVDAERSLLRAIGGGCLAPLGAYAEVVGTRVRLRAVHLEHSSAPPAIVDLHGWVSDVNVLVAAATDALRPVGTTAP